MRRLIVDGYNVLHASPDYEALAERDIDSARARLVEDVAAFSVGRFRATVVFDGAGNPASRGEPHHVAGVAVVFSKAGQEADATIESLAWRSRERGEGCVVATSDGDTQRVVASAGVARMSSAELVREMQSAKGEARTHHVSGSVRGRLEERVSPEVRDKLFRWARSR